MKSFFFFFPLTLSCTLTGHLQRSSAQSLSEITAKALRAINATEKAVSESLQGQSWGSDGCALHLSMEDGKEAAEAYRKLEENVRFPRASVSREGIGGGSVVDSPCSLLVGAPEVKGWAPQAYMYKDAATLPAVKL